MATNQLPMFSNNQNGPAKKDDKSSDALQLIKFQKNQLDVLNVMATLLTNINQNLSLIAINMLPEALRNLIDQSEMLEDSRARKNELKEKESEREGKLGGGAAKPEGMFDSLNKLFEDYFGIFKTVFTIIKAILIPMVLGFVVGFRKKFDLLSVAITLAILYPIRALKLMVRVFGVLFEALKGVGKLISKIGPVFQGAVKGITNFFRRMRIFFLRTLDLKNILKPITSLFSGGAGMFSGLAKTLGGIFRVFGKLFLPLTIIIAVYDGIMGAIEGFKEGGILGGIKGALVGIINGLVGWLVGIGQWIVVNLLELFGFDGLAKIVEEFNFKEFLNKFIGFFFPIMTLIDLFDENSVVRKQISAALDNFSNLGSFISNIWKDITEAIKNMFVKLVEAIPGGSALLSALGFKVEKKEQPFKNLSAARDAAVDAATKAGKSEDEINAIRNAKTEEELRAATAATTGEKTKAGLTDWKSYIPVVGTMFALNAYKTAKSDALQAAEATNKAGQIDEATKEADKAKQPEPMKAAVTNTTVVNAPNNTKNLANINRPMHADRVGIGSAGSASFSGFNKAYT